MGIDLIAFLHFYKKESIIIVIKFKISQITRNL